MGSFPNQLVLNFENKMTNDREHPYYVYNEEAMRAAMQNLKNDQFKLWCYLAHQPEGSSFALGQKPCENVGIKKDAYYSAKDILIEKGYIVKHEDNHWYFHEIAEKPTLTAKDF